MFSCSSQMGQFVQNLDSGVDIQGDLDSVLGAAESTTEMHVNPHQPSRIRDSPSSHDCLDDFARNLQSHLGVECSNSRVPFFDPPSQLFGTTSTSAGLWIRSQNSLLDTGRVRIKNLVDGENVRNLTYRSETSPSNPASLNHPDLSAVCQRCLTIISYLSLGRSSSSESDSSLSSKLPRPDELPAEECPDLKDPFSDNSHDARDGRESMEPLNEISSSSSLMGSV